MNCALRRGQRASWCELAFITHTADPARLPMHPQAVYKQP